MQFLYLDFSHFYLACGFYTLISDIFSLACGLLFMCNGLSVELVYFFYPVIPTRVVGASSPKRTPFRAFPVAARIVNTQAHTCGCRAAGSVLRACPEAGGTSPHGPPRSGRATGTHGPSGHVVRNTYPPSRLPIEAARNTTNGPLLPRCVVAYDIPGCL
jgi:hypothetical protein